MKQIKLYLFILILTLSSAYADIDKDFEIWKKNFKKIALENNISEKTFDTVMSDTKFLSNVIKYDRYQPEFYEDTKTYISKRTSSKKVLLGKEFYEKNFKLINSIENKYNIERELLLSLMGIETNFGKYVGKMDILSSLATLSFDKRRTDFFTNELLILLRLIENKQIDYKTLYGSWAGAFGFFQFMPSTMKNYAIDYDNNGYIDLKNNNDAYASASNYLYQIGWKNNQPCFYKIELEDNIPRQYLNISAKKIHDKKKLKFFRKYIKNSDEIDKIYDNSKVAIVTSDKDIIPDAETLKPAFVVFHNYEIILKWNRSLRFALAVCTLKDKFKNEL